MKTAQMRCVLSVFLLLMAGSSFATATDTLVKRRAKAGTPIVPGQWHADFSKVKKYAEDHGLPLMAVWSNGDECSHCLKLERCLNHTTFYSWQQTSGIVFYFGYNKDKSGEDCPGGKGYNWCWKSQSLDLFPFVRYYWKAKKGTVLADGTVVEKDKVLVDKAVTGDTVDSYKDNAEGSKKALAYTQKQFKQFVKPSEVKDFGGTFVFADTPSAGLQVEYGTGTLDVQVPITRTNDTAVANVYTNTLVVTQPGKAATSTEIKWEAGDDVKYVTVTVDKTTAVGKTVELVLKNNEGEGVATNHIYLVDKVENSPSNPAWIGEKTKDTLKWGEWTMDLAVATNTVKAKGGDATLILVGGSQWCPDCVALDKWLIDTDEFKTWAKTTHKIACVAIDVPKMGAKTPSLLTYDANATSARFYTYNYSSETNEDLKVTGGAGYLSRHAIPQTGNGGMNATAIAARNQELLTNAVPVGLCRPECIATDNRKTGQFKTGIPALILMDPNGRIAGRIYQFNNVSPSKPAPELVNRLEELFLQMESDSSEENNDDISTLGEGDKIALRETISDKTISAVDQTDYYALGAAAKGQVVSVRLTGAEAANMTLTLVNRAKSTEEELVSKTGLLDDDVEVHYEIPTSNCYIKVSYPTDKNGYGLVGERFSFTTNVLTTCAYSIATDTVLVPQSEEKTVTITDGNRSVTMRLVEGQSYRITNLDETDAAFADYFTKGVTKNIYAAKESCAAVLKLTADTFTYRLWDTGFISFTKAGDSVSEKDSGWYALEIGRLGGGSAGAAAAYLRLDPTSTNYNDLIEFDTSDANCHLTWADGETNTYRRLVHVVNNGYADGGAIVRFYLEQPKDVFSDAGLGVKDFLLTIFDDDVAKSGKLALTALNPLPSKAGVAYAREGTKVRYGVRRVGGTTGTLSGNVTSSAGGEPVAVQFANRDEQGRAFNYELPMLSKAKSVKLTVTGTDGAKVDSSARSMTYKLVSAKAPEFEQPLLSIDATRYVAIESQTVKVSDEYLGADGALSIVKTSGSLPSGVKATISSGKDAITFSGIPSKAGSFTATYQVKKGKTEGLTLTVTVVVTDPTVTPGVLLPKNDTIVKTRTLKDIRVIDTENHILLGLMNLTVPRTGKLSAKFRSLDAKSVSYSCKSWSDYADDGAFVAELTTSKTGFGDFTVRAKNNGDVEILDPTDGLAYEVPNKAFTAQEAQDYKGLYTISLKQGAAVEGEPLAKGDGYVTLRLTKDSQIKKSSVIYGGLLPNGKAFSGSATLAPFDWDDTLEIPGWAKAKLPLFLYSAEDVFSGVLEIDRAKVIDYGKIGKGRRPVANDAAAQPYWYHLGKTGLRRPYAVTFEAFGGLYKADENFALKDEDSGTKLNLSFFADPTALDSEASSWDKTGYGVTVTYAEKKKTNTIAAQSSGAAKGFSLKYDSSTGIVKGSFRMPADNDDGYVTMSYRAVVLPGWGGANCAECGGTEEQNARPFICGAAWFTDKLPYLTEAMEQKGTKTVKENRGCAVSVGTEAGH